MSGEANSKYSPEMQKKAQYYLENYEKLGRQVPSALSLCRYLEVAEKTLYEWVKKEENEAFRKTLGQIQAEQAQVLIDKGLNGDFNATIAKLMLANHGYHDKKDVNVRESHNGGDEEAEEILKEIGFGSEEDDDAEPVPA